MPADSRPTRRIPVPAPIAAVAPTGATAASPVPAPSTGRSGKIAKPAGRLVSLDAYRGFIMGMLAASGFGIARFAGLDADLPVWSQHDRGVWGRLAYHFEHPEWVSVTGFCGVSFWDLIQPAFMFMVGVAMPFSYARRKTMGAAAWKNAGHAVLRSAILVLMGVFLASVGKSHTVWEFPNVLCQIGLGYGFAYAFLGRRRLVQIIATGVILVGYWMFFFLNPPPAEFDYAGVNVADEDRGSFVFDGRFAPWSKNSNIAHRIDLRILNVLRTPPVQESAKPSDATAASPDAPAQVPQAPDAQQPPVSGDVSTEPVRTADVPAGERERISETPEATVPANREPSLLRKWLFSNPIPFVFNAGGYTTLNFVPSIATTLLGIICGQLILVGGKSRWITLLILLGTAAGCLLLGVAAHHTVCPIIKRIWTPSWVLFSGGYVIGLLALFYFAFDILPLRRLAFPLVVMGMNSIVIYMAGQLLRGWTIRTVIRPHLTGILESVAGPRLLDMNWYGEIAEPSAVFVLFWLTALWLYRQRIFVRI